ncbi:uncharacterized protein LOC101858642 [Aplysia californica]|uniref:Uncharacterized protein LOC101858642 n=1 Tax=Aplysia californica TaxID=6500 RepID=A0ABM0JUM9_APLCA|nr:uncharacterized protein LOC101858642 [Aplysia californica]
MSIGVTCVFLVFPASYIPVFIVHKIDWRFDPVNNQTRLMAAFTSDREHVRAVSYYINDVVLPTVCILVVLACTLITNASLRSSARWKREKMGSSRTVKDDNKNSNKTKTKIASSVSNAAGRENRVARMVLLISAMFVVCFSPFVLLLYVRFVYPEIGMWEEQHNLYICLYGIVFTLEMANSILNVFVYYGMSTRYRETCLQIFCSSRSNK